jgi:hypothetical protein
MAKRMGPRSRIKAALARAEAEVRRNAGAGGHYARGLSGEGYAGGYVAALQDVLLDDGSQTWEVAAAAAPHAISLAALRAAASLGTPPTTERG